MMFCQKYFALITQVQPQGVKQIKGCQWDNTNHTYLLRGLLLGEYFHERPQKNLFKILKKNLHYYVKVYEKKFKKYLIFKSFETHVQVNFVLKSNHYNV